MKEEDDVEQRDPESDERVIESEDPEAEEKAEGKVKKLRGEIESLRKEKQEYLDGWQRAKADYVNALRRFEEEKAVAAGLGTAVAAQALLPALEALERAKEHGAVPEGFQAIVKQLEAGFAKLGIETMGTIGEAFDPAFHEALGQDRVESQEEDGTITAVLERGWKMNDVVIRPAKVRIAHFETKT